MPIPYYYNSSAELVLKSLKSGPKGLTHTEVALRREKFGLNELIQSKQERWYHILLKQFTEIMVIILIIAMAVSFALGEFLDGYAILVIILLNAAVGFVQEFKAEKTVEALKQLTNPQATVMRDNKLQIIDAKYLVPGDIILLEEGEKIPADARLLEIAELEVSEASLTGESNPISKHIKAIKEECGVGDRLNMVYLGTIITKGHAKAVVTKIGMQSEFGRIAHMVQTAKTNLTPLQKQLNKLSKYLAIITLGIISLLMISSIFSGQNLMEMFFLSISLAVSVIPEGLPAIITLTLALGVQKMAKKRAVIRRLSAAETLGSVSVICTDKTGTLTKNQMTVEKIFYGLEDYAVSGVGYNPKGNIAKENTKLSKEGLSQIRPLLESITLCNNAELIKKKSKWTIFGDPTEATLLTLASKGGINLKKIQKEFPRKKELIFDSSRKLMSTLNQHGSEYILHTKGAPDELLQVCSHIQLNGKMQKLSSELKNRILKQNEAYAKQAYRVLGVARKSIKSGQESTEKDLVFLGLVAMIDPPRSQVKRAMQRCKEAQIDVVMITGDHALTAKAIGQKIGLVSSDQAVLTGTDLDNMSFEELKQAVSNTKIFARVSPKHKVLILEALQAKQAVVAMTGDGVNDAPALKKADIGIAMGITGSDVSKEAGQMILMDDNFTTIVNAVESGRTIYNNIKKFIRFLLSSNFDEILLISVVFAMQLPIPFIPLQILWINLLTDALPAIALGVDSPEKDIMKKPPRDTKKSIFKELIGFSLVAGSINALISLYLYFNYLNTVSIEHLRTVIFTTAVMFELFLVFSVRSDTKHYFSNFFSNKLLWLGIFLSFCLQLIVVYSEKMQQIFETEPLNFTDWQKIIGLSILGLICIELWKFWRFKKHNR
jgi:Ca2+-transporting ATPase